MATRPRHPHIETALGKRDTSEAIIILALAHLHADIMSSPDQSVAVTDEQIRSYLANPPGDVLSLHIDEATKTISVLRTPRPSGRAD